MKQYNKLDYRYTALFCEENIWYLAQSLIQEGIQKKDLHILFLSNKNGTIALFNQLSADSGKAVIWDYHVILMANIDKKDVIFDFDTRLDFPCTTTSYLKNSLPDKINTDFQSKIRLIPAQEFLQRL